MDYILGICSDCKKTFILDGETEQPIVRTDLCNCKKNHLEPLLPCLFWDRKGLMANFNIEKNGDVK